MRQTYSVGKQYGRGPETKMPERFQSLEEAKQFVDDKAADDAAMNIKTIYRIYEDGELHSEYDSSKVDLSKRRGEESQGSQGKGSKSTFTPTPFNMAPRPAGTPPKWLKDEDEDEKKK